MNIDVKSGIVTRGINDYDKLDEKDFYETVYAAAGRPSSSAMVRLLGGYNAYNVPDDQLFTAEGKINPSASLKYHDDWQKEAQRVGFKQDYNISASDAGKYGNYYFAAGYLNEKGYIKTTSFERGNISFNSTINIRSWLKAGMFVTGAISSQHFVASGTSVYNPFYVSRLIPSIYPVYYRNANGQKETAPLTGKDKFDWGTINDYPESSMGERPWGTATNLIGSFAFDDNANRLGSVLASPYIETVFLKQFTFNASFQYNINRNNQTQLSTPFMGNTVLSNNKKTEYIDEAKIYTIKSVLTWEKELGNHSIKIATGHEAYHMRQDYAKYLTEGMNPKRQTESNLYYTTNEGYYLNGDYNFKEKYFLSAGVRRDGTSNLPPSSRWGTYWATGIAYQINKEHFLQSEKWIDVLKIKASYGTQGNSGLPARPWGFTALNIGSEKINHFNAGIDFEAFQYRLRVVLEAYHNKNPSGIVLIPPGQTGVPGVSKVQIDNKGLELSIIAYAVRNRNFKWHIKWMAAHNKNTVTMPDMFPKLINTPYALETNNSVYDFYLPRYAGPSPISGEALYYITRTGSTTMTTRDYGELTKEDYKNQGPALPYLYGSLSNTFSYKQFDFSFQFNYSLGGKYYDQVYADLMGSGTFLSNWSPDILNRWTAQNTAADIPRVNLTDMYTNAPSNRFLKNASYLNIKNVYQGYNFTLQRLKKIKLKTLTVYLTAENLWLFTAAKGIDPQASFDGIGRYGYIPARTIMMGINVGI